MTTFDCCLFGLTTRVLLSAEPDSVYTSHCKNHCQNLVKYTDRIMESLWPDWDDASFKIMNEIYEFELEMQDLDAEFYQYIFQNNVLIWYYTEMLQYSMLQVGRVLQ